MCHVFALLVALPATAGARPITVVAAGDLSLGEAVADPLAEIAGALAGDVRLANLEGPLTARAPSSGLDGEGRPIAGATVRLAAPPQRASTLRGRLDVVSLANNHALDQGAAGLDDTRAHLERAGVAWADASRDAVLTRAGRRVIVIARAFAPDADLDGERALIERVQQAAATGAVLVTLEWGHTGSLLPTAAQRRLAARLVDAGARAVLGHGPHTIQGVERRRGAVIAYSLGNLAFACRCTDVTDSLLLRFTLGDDGSVSTVELEPLHAGIREPARASHDGGLLDLLEELERDLGARVQRKASLLSL